MKYKNLFLISILIFLLAACSSPKNLPAPTADFVTAVLPTPFAPLPTAALSTSAPDANYTPTQMPLIEGTTTTQVNVRAQPSKDGAVLGMLGIFAKVQIVGRNSSGEWYQVIYADSLGWVSAAYVQVDDANAIPLLTADTPTPAPMIVLPTESLLAAMQDGDSMQAPLGTVVFSPLGVRAVQLNGEISAPGGDVEDWFRFASSDPKVFIEVSCDGDLQIELWNRGLRVDTQSFSCGDKRFLPVGVNEDYWLHLSLPAETTFQHVIYVITLKSLDF